jgi:ABC-type uncharacterized transport system ATPase subunit
VADPKQATILESFWLTHNQRNAARTLEHAIQQLLRCIMLVSHEPLPTEEVGRLLMETER